MRMSLAGPRRRRSPGGSALLLGAWTALASFAAAPIAHAQAPSEPEVTMPSPRGPTAPPYPPGGEGDAQVVLGLLVRADGTVSEARVIEGQEPFASAAASAAASWEFEPARRNGKPVSVRIRFLVTFHAPAPPEELPPPAAPIPAPSPAPAAMPAPPAPREPEALEVMVQGEHVAPTTRTMSRVEVRQLPGAFGDPFRAIEAMPGVTPIASGVPYFFVRGAPPGNIGYFLDGVRVPLLFHVAAGPSVVHPALIDRVDLYPGGFPARYGRFTGGIVTGSLREPELRFHGEGNIRLFDVGAMVEAPFDDGRGAALVAGRYAYPELALKIFSPGIELGYWDYQARVHYDLSPTDRIGVFAFGSHDYLAQIEEDGEREVVVAGQFHRVDLRYDTRLGDRGKLRHAITLGYEESNSGDGERTGSSWLLGSRTELLLPVSRDLSVRGGADAYVERFDIDIEEQDDDYPSLNDQALARQLTSRTDFTGGVWADVVWRPLPALEVVPGLRSDVFTSDGAAQATLDPRLATRLEMGPRFALVSAFGVTHQPPSFLGAIPGLQIGGLRGGVQTGLLASAGVEATLPLDVTASVTGFRGSYFNLSDPLGNRPPATELGYARQAELRGLGSTYGVEINLRRSLSKRLGGFLSYTLSRSVRHIGAETFDSAFDRRHVLNLAASYDFGRGWRLGGRVMFYTGAPMTLDYRLRRRGEGQPDPTPNEPDRPDTLEDILAREELRRLLAEYVKGLNLPERLPAFFRLDVRLEKRWSFDHGRWLSFTVEALNATASKETTQYECTFVDGCAPEELGPIVIPSIGLEGGF
ncbi:TonB-dependent receptor domain-containing protein [Polyangium aurulentum]|uniref:TonB-dependent receptor domain-containing protein n=1 Tax=Polyangium aurulentum TaxID=2567896 RepID=UPI0010AED89A|nr:TonB-dependent receptor [Polyangium aurulentum]UQA57495.1 TonB-dependent receptor [Polyangium aurulentum]